MSYRLVRTSYFERRLARFQRQHPDIKRRLARVLSDLEEDPRRPQLRLHGLHGELEGLSAVWVGYDSRLVVAIEEATKEIVLVNIGTHDEVYGPR